MNTPPFLSPLGQRFSFMNPRTPRTTSRSPLLSPTRIRPMDDLLADLSPANTFEAFTSNNTSALKKSIEAASPEERAFGIRAAHASQKIEEWVTELSEWKWPEGGSTGFELPIAKRRRLSKGSEGSNEGLTGDLPATPRVEEPEQTEEEYWGSMPVQAVLQYEARIEEITEDMEDLEVEEIKKQVLETHILPRSRPSSSHDAQPAPSFHSYTKMDDFTAVVTATVLQALPNLARLTSLMDVWSVRIVVLRNIQPVLIALEDMEVAMKSAWNAIEKPDGEQTTDLETSENPHLSRKTFDTIRNVLQSKVGKLGQQLDNLLDTLEGRQDTVPDSWLDRMEKIEENYSNWTVYGDQKVLEGEWEEQKKRRAAAEPTPVLDDLKSKEEQELELDPDHKTENSEKLEDTVQRGITIDSAEEKLPTFMKTPPSATTDAPYETIIEKSILNATEPPCTEPLTESASKATPAAPFVLKRPPQSIETRFDAQEDQVDPPDTPSRNPRNNTLRISTSGSSIPKAKFTSSKDEANAEPVGLGVVLDSSEPPKRDPAFMSSSNEPNESDAIVDSISNTVIHQELPAANTSAVDSPSSSNNPEHNMLHEDKAIKENTPVPPTDIDSHSDSSKQVVNKTVEGSDVSPTAYSGVKEDIPLSNKHATEIDAPPKKETPESPQTRSTPHSKHSVESLHSQFDGVRELPTPPELEGAQVDGSSLPTHLPTTASPDLRDNNKSEQAGHRKETPPSSTTSSVVSDMDDSMEDQSTTPARPLASEIRTPPRPEFGVERATSPHTPSSAGSATSRAIRSPSNQPGTYKKDMYLEDGGTPRSPNKRRLDIKEFAVESEPSSPEKSSSQRHAVTTFSTSPITSPKRQSPTGLGSGTQVSDSPVQQSRTLPEVEIQPVKDTTCESQLQDSKSAYVRSPSPSEESSYSASELNPKALEAEPTGHFKPVLSPIKSPRHLGDEYDGAAPTKHAPIPLDEFPGFADINARGFSPETLSAHESDVPKALELSDLAAPDTPSPKKYDQLGGLQLSDVDNDSALEDTEEETPDPDVRRASVVSIGKMSRASLKTISRPSSSESGTPITPWKKRFEDSFMTPIHGENPDLMVSPPLSVTSITPSIVTTDANDPEMSPPIKKDTIKQHLLVNNPQARTHAVVSSIQKRAELFEKASSNHLSTPPSVHTPRHRSVSMATPKSTSMQDSPQTDPGTPPSGFTPKEPPHLKNVAVSHTPPVKSPAKASQDQFHQQITQVLQNIPAQIRLTAEPKNPKSELQVVKKRPSIMSLTDGRRPLTRPSSPAFTLAPAGGRRPRASNGAPEIKLYHLSRSTGEAPIKLFVRLVGENGERVMVRVGGGWADLGEYLKEYASHHRRVDRDGKVEVQDLSPRSVSNASNYGRSSPLQRPATSMGRASSRLGSRPPSSLERPMSTLAHRRSRLSLGEEARDSPRTPSAMSMRRYDTPPSAGSYSRPSSRASMANWTDEDGSLGLAGPKSKRIEITEEDEKWIESMKEKVRLASAEKGKSFGDIGKAGGTKRLFHKGA